MAEPRDVLVGGLGLGYTMHRVLADSRVERCSVVEIEQALVEWMRDGTIPHGPELLADERANAVVADIAAAVGEAADASYDLVLLDVDNGPGYLVHEHNAALYRPPFLTEVRADAPPRRCRGDLVGRPRRPSWRPPWSRCSATPRPPGTTSPCRTATSSTGCTSHASAQ